MRASGVLVFVISYGGLLVFAISYGGGPVFAISYGGGLVFAISYGGGLVFAISCGGGLRGVFAISHGTQLRGQQLRVQSHIWLHFAFQAYLSTIASYYNMDAQDIQAHFERSHDYAKLGEDTKASFTAPGGALNYFPNRYGLSLYEDSAGYLLTWNKYVEILFQHENQFTMRFIGEPPAVVGTKVIDDLWPTNPRVLVLQKAVDFRNPTAKPTTDGFKAAHFPFTDTFGYVAQF